MDDQAAAAVTLVDASYIPVVREWSVDVFFVGTFAPWAGRLTHS
jgi:hypothetical protein